MAFYELTATQLQTSPNVKYDSEWDIYRVVWNNNLSDNVYYKYCALIESTVDSSVYESTIIRGYNTVTSDSYFVYKVRANNYFSNRNVKVKVCATDNVNIDTTEFETYTKSLQGQTFMYYNPPYMEANNGLESGDTISVNQQISFAYNSTKTTEYVKIKLYNYDLISEQLLDLVDEYTQSNISSGSKTITPTLAFQNYKNYALVFEIKEVNGSFGETSRFPFILFTGQTQYYNNIDVIGATRYIISSNGQLKLENFFELDLDNPNSEEIALYTGLLKYGDSYSNHEQDITHYVDEARYLASEGTHSRFVVSSNPEIEQYYSVSNQRYDISLFGVTYGRRIEDSEVYQRISNATVSFNTAFFLFNINSEIGANTYVIKKLLLNNDGKYNFHVDFSAESNSIIDYVEFSLYNQNLGIIATSPKIYNDRNDTETLSLGYDFDFNNLDRNLRYSLIVNIKTTYGSFVKCYYYTFNSFTVEKFINNIDIKKIEYINGESTYTYRVYGDCEEHIANVGLVLNTADNSSYLTYQNRQDPNNYMDFVVNKSNATFTQQNTPYFIQIGAKENGTLSSTDFDLLRQNAEKYVVYYVLPPNLSINIDEGDVISNSSYTFLVNYYGSEEPLDYAIFTLYDANGNVLRESPKIFNVNNPPLILYYTFDGFEDDTTYKVGVYAKSLHGDEVEIEPISFSVSYESTILKAPIIIKNKCNDGYIEVKSNIFTGKGESNPDPMIFMQDGLKYSAYAVSNNPVISYGSETSSWVYWGEHIDINTDFILKFWFTVGTINNNIIRLYNDEGEYVNIKFNRKGSAGDYVEVSNSQGLVANSNIVTHTNSTNEYFLWVKAVGNEWDIRLTELDSEETVFNLNDSNNNLHYNMTSDMHWYGESYENNYRIDNSAYNINNFTKVLVGNAICKTIEITNDINLPYSVLPDAWGEDTVMFCDFDRNLNCGNLKEELGNIDSIRIKRKDETNNTWITLYEEDVTVGEDLNIYHRDYGVPKGIEQTYALVPVLPNGDEGEYVIDTVTPNWNGVFISDGEKCFKLYSSVSYGSVPRNTPVGVLNPIGSQYPIVITNSTNDYRSGMLSGMLLGYNYEKTRVINRVDIVKQTNDYIDFLKNGKTKFITDWNGNCWVVRLTDSPTIDFNVANTNGISTVKFSWVEQGKYNNEEDLKRNNLI